MLNFPMFISSPSDSVFKNLVREIEKQYFSNLEKKLVEYFTDEHINKSSTPIDYEYEDEIFFHGDIDINELIEIIKKR